MWKIFTALLVVGAIASGSFAEDVLVGSEYWPEKDAIMVNEDPGTEDHNYGNTAYRGLKWHQFNHIVDWSDASYADLNASLDAQALAGNTYGDDYVLRMGFSSYGTSGGPNVTGTDPDYTLNFGLIRIHAIISQTDWVEGNGTVMVNTADGCTYNSINGLLNGDDPWEDALGNEVDNFTGVIGELNAYITHFDSFTDYAWDVSYYVEDEGPLIKYNYFDLSADMLTAMADPYFQGFALSSDGGANTYILTKEQWGDTGNQTLAVYEIGPDFQEADFDEDGDVDGFDFGKWQVGYPMASGAQHIDGDADGDGDVDGFDFGIWQVQYVPPAGNIPEPATMSMLALGGMALLRRRK